MIQKDFKKAKTSSLFAESHFKAQYRLLKAYVIPRGWFNPYLTNNFSHHYQMGESTFIYRGVRSDFYFFIQFFDEFSLSKQISPRWDAAFCGVTSGAVLFANVP